MRLEMQLLLIHTDARDLRTQLQMQPCDRCKPIGSTDTSPKHKILSRVPRVFLPLSRLLHTVDYSIGSGHKRLLN